MSDPITSIAEMVDKASEAPPVKTTYAIYNEGMFTREGVESFKFEDALMQAQKRFPDSKHIGLVPVDALGPEIRNIINTGPTELEIQHVHIKAIIDGLNGVRRYLDLVGQLKELIRGRDYGFTWIIVGKKTK